MHVLFNYGYFMFYVFLLKGVMDHIDPHRIVIALMKA